MAETTEQPLLRSPSQQTAVDVGAQVQGSRSTRAYKVAGITLLASVLIVSQIAIAYFLLSQRNDIKSLKEQNDGLKEEMTKVQSVPVSMHRGVAAPPLDGLFPEDSSTASPGPHQSTKCLMEAEGLIPETVPDFRPLCDERGLYKAQQCFKEHCWCVDVSTGEMIPNTIRRGLAQCNRTMIKGGLVPLLQMEDTDALHRCEYTMCFSNTFYIHMKY